MPERCDVLLISMPWPKIGSPSIQLGILKAVLERDGIATQSRSFYVTFLEHLLRSPEAKLAGSLEHYEMIAGLLSSVGAGDWVFAVPPFQDLHPHRDEAYRALLRDAHRLSLARAAAPTQDPEALFELLVAIRREVPAFLASCAEDVLAASPRIVGFTTAFSQSVASLVLAKLLKERRPDLSIVFGGGNCAGPMGAAQLRCFPWIDAVVRGEAEKTVVSVVRDLLDGGPVRPVPGLCYRNGAEQTVVEEAFATVPMDDVPLPDYTEYFEKLGRSGMALRVTPRITFESSRGCWWGERQHCTFCGLNGADMTSRSKSVDRTFDDIMELARRHRHVSFFCVDNIIDLRHLKLLIPRIREAGLDLRFFYETKSNLKKEQVRSLRDAGVLEIQPGIESLSTPILSLMRKGVTALQNVRLLKWCAQFGVRPFWNLLYGFPREPPDEYPRMAELMRSLTHLPPPALNPLRLDRFSPYHTRPAELGIVNLGPAEFYRHLYDVDPADLADLAYCFEHRHVDGRDPETYVGPVREAIDKWVGEAAAGRRRGASPTLSYARGPGFLIVTDRRTVETGRYTLEERTALLYEACDEGATVESALSALRADGDALTTREEVLEFLDGLAEERLVVKADGRYLSLAIADSSETRVSSTPAVAEEDDRPLVQLRRGA